MKIGVTGIFASGKGTVCEMFEELGSKTIDTDIIAREVVEPGTEGLKTLVEVFGKEILNDNGTLNRQKLADIVFADPVKVKRLNEITHPLVFKRIMETFEDNPNDIFIVNIPLLFESGFDNYLDKTIVVTANTDQVINRGIKRDSISESDIKKRLNHQIPLNEKIKKADYIIDNSGTLENTKRQVLKIWKIFQKKRAGE